MTRRVIREKEGGEQEEGRSDRHPRGFLPLPALPLLSPPPPSPLLPVSSAQGLRYVRARTRHLSRSQVEEQWLLPELTPRASPLLRRAAPLRGPQLQGAQAPGSQTDGVASHCAQTC